MHRILHVDFCYNDSPTDFFTLLGYVEEIVPVVL